MTVVSVSHGFWPWLDSTRKVSWEGWIPHCAQLSRVKPHLIPQKAPWWCPTLAAANDNPEGLKRISVLYVQPHLYNH